MINSLAAINGYLYAAVRGYENGHLSIFSLNNGQPALSSHFDYVAGEESASPVTIIQITDQLAYLFEYERILVLDVSSPDSPMVVQKIPLSLFAETAQLFNTTLVLKGRNAFDELTVTYLDVSDPSSPVVLHRVREMAYIAGGEDKMVISSSGTMRLYDMSSSSEPVLLSTYDPNDGYTRAINFDGNLLYARTENTIEIYTVDGDFNFVKSINLTMIDGVRQELTTPFGKLFFTYADKGYLFSGTSPETKTLTAEFALSSGNDIQNIAFTDSAAVAVQFHFGLTTHDPQTLAQRGRLDLERVNSYAAFESIAVDNNVAYLANWGSGLVSVDVSDPSNPIQIGHLDLGYVSSIAIDSEAKIALLGQSTNGGVLYVVDISEPTNPILLNQYTWAQVKDIVFSDGYFFVGTNGLLGGDSELSIVEVTATSLTQMASYNCGQAIRRTSVDNGIAAITCLYDLHIIDVSEPSNPKLQGIFSPEYYTTFGATAIKGTRAYISHSFGIDEVSIADPTNPRLIKTIPALNSEYRLVVSPDGKLYSLGQTNAVYRDKE